MQWRGAITNQLSDVIQTIQLVRRSGTLKVEKNEDGAVQEEGTITFMNGQITDAQMNVLRGSAAYGKIMSWKSCRFTFLPAESAQPSAGPLASFSSDSYTSRQDTNSGMYSIERSRSLSGSGFFHDMSMSTGNRLTRDTAPVSPNRDRDTGATNRVSNIVSVPYRIREVNEVLPAFASMGLSRLHRHLFLLIDGRRSLSELVQVLGRQPGEVYMLLADLERAGFIRQ